MRPFQDSHTSSDPQALAWPGEEGGALQVRRSIAGENPEPEINLESSRKRKTSKMAREQRPCGEGRAGSIRGSKDLVPPGMVGRTPWGSFQGQ